MIKDSPVIVKEALHELAKRVVATVPGVLCSIDERQLRGGYQVCASFLLGNDSDTIDLCVVLRTADLSILASADLVRGGTGVIIAELQPITIVGIPAGDHDFLPIVDFIRSNTQTTITAIINTS